MASSNRLSTGEGSIPAVSFSYAQAAKGISSSHASAQTSRATSGAITPVTPAKESSAAPSLKSELAPGTSWADDVEIGHKEKEKEKDNHSTATTVVDTQPSPTATSPVIQPSHLQLNGLASPPSPDFGSSSTSTLAREDDASSVPISSSDSTWENKSQGSHVPEKRQASADRAPSKGRNKKGSRKNEKSEDQDKDWSQPALPLHEAPIPVVNPWNNFKSKIVAKPVQPARTTPTNATDSVSKLTADKDALATSTTASKAAKPETKGTSVATSANAESVRATTDAVTFRKEGEDRGQRREQRSGGKNSERVEKSVPVASPPMDQESWPTPDTVAELVHEKTEKSEKSRVESTPAPVAKGKSAWEKVDFIPSVVFNTPLPGASRRGGRGGSRGGRESSGRGGASSASGEKGSSSQTALTNGDSSRRGRTENSARGSSPAKGKRASSDEAPRRDTRPVTQSKEVRPTDANPVSEPRTLKTSEVNEESNHNSNAQSNTLPRSGNPPRPKTNRRSDLPPTNGEKRKEGEAGKENEAISSSRRTSISTQHNENGDKKFNVPSDAAAASRYSTSERRNGQFSSFSRDRPDGGRGRGGHRGSRNGTHTFHQNGQAPYPNGQIQGSHSNPAYGLSRSPTGFQQEPYYGHQHQNSRSFRGGPSRAQSIPVDNYPRLSNGYGINQLPQINTFVGGNGMYDYTNMLPMSAAPYTQTPYVDPYALLPMVTQQMEYYFSVDNLCKDVYMRKHMDSQGFILLSFIADFKRLKTMTTDLELIKYVCQQSPNIEHCLGTDSQDRLRVRLGWEKWVMPIAERDHSAQNEGPEALHIPPVPQPQVFEPKQQMRQTSLPSAAPMSAPPVPYQSLNGFASVYGNFGPSLANDANCFQTSPTGVAPITQVLENTRLASPLTAQDGLPNGSVEHETDSFSDAQVEQLRVIVRQPNTLSSMPSGPVRSFSNGSLDGLNVTEELGITAAAPVAPASSGTATTSDAAESRKSPVPKDRIASFLSQNGRIASSINGSLSDETASSASAISEHIFWMKDKTSPARELPPDTSSEFYTIIRARALEQRALPNTPACPYDMDVLYQFWSHFLIRNFNYRMYSEFRELAEDDIINRNSSVGRQNLIKFFSGALAHIEPIRHIVARDYIELVNSEPRESGRPAYKQLRTAWRDGALNMKNRKHIKQFIGSELEAELDGRA